MPFCFLVDLVCVFLANFRFFSVVGRYWPSRRFR